MKITYWSDFACPYCYIGNTRLKRAIKDLDLDVEFDIRAFELDQNAPKDVESTTVERFAIKYGLSREDAEKQVARFPVWELKKELISNMKQPYTQTPVMHTGL